MFNSLANSHPPTFVDVAIIGAGPSGLAAALSLSRVGRPCVVFNAGTYRNANVLNMHNVLGNDGRSNVEFREESRRQLEAYGTVKFLDGVVVIGVTVNRSSIKPGSPRFSIRTDGPSYTSDAVILASGITDVPTPSIRGLSAAWSAGKIVNCIYCHGYEFRREKVAAIVLDGDFITLHGAVMGGKFRDARDMIVLTNGTANNIAKGSPAANSLKKLKAMGVRYDDKVIQDISIQPYGLLITFINSSDTIQVSVLIHTPHTVISPTIRKIALELGISPTTSMLPGHELIAPQDGLGHSEVEGVYICGDLATVFRSISASIASGSLAAGAAHGDMVMA
jgi:thioredoxin reductase